MKEDDLIKVFDALNIKRWQRLTGNYSISCPLAPWTHPKGTDNNPSMSVSISDDDVSLVNCWSCKFTGTIADLVKRLNLYLDGKLEKLVDFVDAAERKDPVAQIEKFQASLFDDIPVNLSKSGKKSEKNKGIIPNTKQIVRDEHELDYFNVGIPSYANERGFDDAICKDFEFGWDKRRNRLTVPVRNMDGKLIGLMGRALSDSIHPKWWAYWNFPKGDYLFNENRIDRDKTLILTEGMFDVMRLFLYGLESPVGIFGSRVTRNQAEKIISLNMPVCLFFDGDASGKLGIEKAGKLLQNRVHLTVMEIGRASCRERV